MQSVYVGSVYPLGTGYWAEESSEVTPVSQSGLVLPLSSPNMLEMDQNGGVVSEAWQFIHLTSNQVSLVEVGTETASVSYWFSADITNAKAFVSLIFYASPVSDGFPGDGWDNPISYSPQVYTTVANPGTWYEENTGDVPVPANTTWIGVHLAFDNSTLGPGLSGYADVVPEPATWALLAGGFGSLLFFMRRRRGTAD